MSQQPDDPITDFLRKQGASYAIVANGLRGLVENWERVVDQVSKGYPQGLTAERGIELVEEDQRDLSLQRQVAHEVKCIGELLRRLVL